MPRLVQDLGGCNRHVRLDVGNGTTLPWLIIGIRQWFRDDVRRWFPFASFGCLVGVIDRDEIDVDTARDIGKRRIAVGRKPNLNLHGVREHIVQEGRWLQEPKPYSALQ